MTTPAHLNALRRRLGQLHTMELVAQQTDAKIRQAAERRLAKVQADLDRLRPRVHLDPAAANEYQDLAAELPHLRRVLSG